jgi:uncharacterized protein (DUF1778 family)
MPVENKSELLHVRVTPSQAELLRATASGEGVRLSEWLRRVALRRAVDRVTADAGVLELQTR